MSEFGHNLPFGNLPILKNLGIFTKNFLSKLNPSLNKTNEQLKLLQQNQNQTDSSQSLANTNSNINLNQQTQASPSVTQGVLNVKGQELPQGLKSDIRTDINKQESKTSQAQSGFQGPKDLPAYAGVANMSLKSWIANYDSKTPTKFVFKDQELASTLEGIKGFQRKSYDGEPDTSQGKAFKRKRLLVLSQIFSTLYEEQASIRETEVLQNIVNFKKLGKKQYEKAAEGESISFKNLPPVPASANKAETLDHMHIKSMHQLLTLPPEFPECIRLFAGENVEINQRDLLQFLEHRLGIVQEQLIGGDPVLNSVVAKFAPLLNQNDFPLILPLVLLYLPLPFPEIIDDFDFLKHWKKQKQKSEAKEAILASCEIYYLSAYLGRFLLKFELTAGGNFNFEIQTREENEHIVKALELAIEEAMYLLENPPNLSELNILLTKEIYEATDREEELAINSTGPLRVEIVLVVYASLVVLNRLNEEPDPAGVIEMH